MGKHHKSNRRKQRRRTTVIYEPVVLCHSYQHFIKAMQGITRRTSGRMIHNPDGSITSISPFGKIITAIYGEIE